MLLQSLAPSLAFLISLLHHHILPWLPKNHQQQQLQHLLLQKTMSKLNQVCPPWNLLCVLYNICIFFYFLVTFAHCLTGLALIKPGEPLSKQAHNALGALFRKLDRQGKGHVKREYEKCKGDLARCSFTLRLKLDPEASFWQVTDEYSASATQHLAKVKDWHALWEVPTLCFREI